MLVFGLDILGNPFGLVRGIKDGVLDLFYEPYLGAVEGPDEFMAGLGTGFKSFFGSTVGGTMGAGNKFQHFTLILGMQNA
jgi:vacuolar protein sorting-associated protein 13A/C